MLLHVSQKNKQQIWVIRNRPLWVIPIPAWRRELQSATSVPTFWVKRKGVSSHLRGSHQNRIRDALDRRAPAPSPPTSLFVIPVIACRVLCRGIEKVDSGVQKSTDLISKHQRCTCARTLQNLLIRDTRVDAFSTPKSDFPKSPITGIGKRLPVAFDHFRRAALSVWGNYPKRSKKGGKPV